MATTTLLWTKHEAPNASLAIFGHRAEAGELEAALAETTLAFGLKPKVSFLHRDLGARFDELNEFAKVSPDDHPAHVPLFLADRMKLQADRRQDREPEAPADNPAPDPFGSQQ